MTLRNLDENQLLCVTIGHQWDPIPSTKKAPFGEYVWLRCMRCAKERHDIVNRFTGQKLNYRYVDPPNWQHVGRTGTRNELRVEMLRRVAAAHGRKLRTTRQQQERDA